MNTTETITYKAMRVTEEANGSFRRRIARLRFAELPAGGVLVRVRYAALNYKDALSASGNKGVTKKYPHTPGIDAAGVIEEVPEGGSRFQPGQQVIVTGYDLGMNTPGGFAEFIAVPETWIVPLPEGLTLSEAMTLGTAGFTAALAIHKMEANGQHPDMGAVLVTGATGGVGSMAVSMLASREFPVIASTGKRDATDYLMRLGAKRIVSREEVQADPRKPLLRSMWAGAIDTIGGNTLSTAIKACAHNGNVAVCGLVGTPKLETTVFPFILNGVNLLGIESAECPMPLRRRIWDRLANELRPDDLAGMATYTSLGDLEKHIERILRGRVMGRVIVDMEL